MRPPRGANIFRAGFWSLRRTKEARTERSAVSGFWHPRARHSPLTALRSVRGSSILTGWNWVLPLRFPLSAFPHKAGSLLCNLLDQRLLRVGELQGAFA